MTRADLKARDLARLAGVLPDLRGRALRVLAAMDALGFPMCVTDSVRTQDQQAALYARGRRQQPDGTWTVIGPTVTNDDGVTRRSNHQIHSDGYGHAVDCTFLVSHDGQDFQPSWEPTLPWQAYGECVKASGCDWGGLWTSITDKPHMELP